MQGVTEGSREGIVDSARLWHLAVFFVELVLLFATVYALLAGTPNGVVSTFGEGPARALGDCIHFSFVTITSLGYGDYRPMGWSRLLAAFEVMSGLALFGVFVSKLASARTSYYTRNLYSSDCQQRLSAYWITLRRARRSLEPALQRCTPDDLAVAFRGDDQWTLRATVWAAARFLSFESQNSEFFRDVPIHSLTEFLNELTALVRLLRKLIRCEHVKQWILSDGVALSTSVAVANAADAVSRIVLDHSTDKTLSEKAAMTASETERLKRAVQSARRVKHRKR